MRNAVQGRYSDTVDYKLYEAQIQKLIDTHIESGEIKAITELVNIFDKEKFAEEVEKVTGTAAKADTIAYRTAKHITENMDADPVFYKRFSQLLKDTIEAYERGRITELEYLSVVTEYMEKVVSHMDETIPAFFERLVVELLVKMGYGGSFEDAAKVTQYSRDNGVDGVIKEDKLGFDVIYIQAKRYDKKNIVGSSSIRDFIGAIDIHHASKGVFITTSSFSDDAKRNAKDSKSKIVLIDGEQLCKYMIEYNLGITVRKTYEIKQLDTDYFAED